MVRAVRITASMFPDLYASLLQGWNPFVSREQWQLAFIDRWNRGDDHFGYALTDDGRIVGMLGMLFSQRDHGGRVVRYCNLHSWRVLPEYRANSLALMKPVLDLKDHVVTDFSPSPAVSAISKRLGFQRLDSTVLMMPPFLAGRRQGGVAVHELRSVDDPEAATLTPSELRILADHQGIDCGHTLARAGGDHCYIVYSRIATNGPPYCLVHHIGAPAMFAAHHAALRQHLLRLARAQYLVVEARHLGDLRVPMAFRANAHEKLYRGSLASPQDIDTLYSEIVLYKHPQLPSLHQRLRDTVKRCLPPMLLRRIGMGG